jgi:UDP:flavonoid glycosyltransferase YjiC (YdhE family)
LLFGGGPVYQHGLGHYCWLVRILFSFIGGIGHFHPLIPVARAAQAAGHTVAVAGSGNLQAAIAEAGFAALPTSEPRSSRPQPPPTVPVVVDPEQEDRDLRENFARHGACRHAAALLGLGGTWHPDVIVRDEVDFGAGIAAELLNVPCATVLVLAAGGFLRKEVIAEPLNEVRAEYDLQPDPELSLLLRDLVLSPFPPAFRKDPLPAYAVSFRLGEITRPKPTSRRPTVYFTLGTVFTPLELYARVLAGLREAPVRVIATLGEHIDPSALGPQPSGVRIERFIPQSLVLPRCDLVISHGGSGSLMGALAHGLPSVLMPLGADQPFNARRCVDLGLATVLDPVTLTPEEVRAAVVAVLADQTYRRAAERMQTEINDLPGPEQTVPMLEGLRRN